MSFILEIKNVGLKKGAFLVYLQDFKTLLPFRKNIHPAVRIRLEHIQNFRRATDGGETLVFVVFASHDAEDGFLVKAFLDHLLVARLKNMQWHRHSRKQ